LSFSSPLLILLFIHLFILLLLLILAATFFLGRFDIDIAALQPRELLKRTVVESTSMSRAALNV
jgi:hypothetical protein